MVSYARKPFPVLEPPKSINMNAYMFMDSFIRNNTQNK
jgi:hypothetical protein